MGIAGGAKVWDWSLPVDVTGQGESRWVQRSRIHRGRPVVAITGMGVVSSLGVGIDENWAALVAGRSGIKRITRFPTEHLRTTIAGTIDFIDEDTQDLKLAIGELATDEAIRMAGSAAPGDFPGPLFTAIPPVELGWPARRRLYDAGDPEIADAYDRMCAVAEGRTTARSSSASCTAMSPEKLADRFGTKGSPVSLTTACASGATAIQLGIEAIRRGETEAALCVGTDCSVTAEEVVRFSLLSALSTPNRLRRRRQSPSPRTATASSSPKAPAALVLEDYDAARGPRREDPRRDPRRRRQERRLPPHPLEARRLGDHRRRSARPSTTPACDPDEIDYINAHGTGTPENDKMECFSLEAVFGERLRGVPISSNKSMIGHTLTSSGRDRGGVLGQDHAERRHPADDQLQGPRPDHQSRRRAQRGARAEGRRRCCPTPSASAGRTPA